MHFDELMNNLAIENPPELWRKCYESTADSKTMGSPLLSKKRIRSISQEMGFPEEWNLSLQGSYEQIVENQSCLDLWKLWHSMLFADPIDLDVFREQYLEWPLPRAMPRALKESFRLLILLTNYHWMVEELHRTNQMESLKYYIANIKGCIEENQEASGTVGLSNDYLWWVWTFMTARIFRIGILEYEISRFIHPYRVFSSRSGEHRALCSGREMDYDEEGYPSENGPHHPTLRCEADRFSGYGFNNNGLFSPSVIHLSREEWTEALQDGDYTLSIHIPGDKKLSPTAVEESLTQAGIFFKEHFSHLDFKAMTCETWLLDKNLKTFLPEKSNILSFQDRFTIIMEDPDKGCLFDYIFQGQPRDLMKLEARNSFQEKILSFLKTGGILRDGLGYILL